MPTKRTMPSYLGPAIPPVSAFALTDILDHLKQECGEASDAMLNVVETFQGDLGLELRRKLDAESKLQLVNSQQARRAHTLSKRASVSRSKLDRHSAKHSGIDDEIGRMIDTAALASSLAKQVASKLHRVQQLINPDLRITSKYKSLERVLPSSERLRSLNAHNSEASIGSGEDQSPLDKSPMESHNSPALDENQPTQPCYSHNDMNAIGDSFEIEATPVGFFTSNSHPTTQLSPESHYSTTRSLLVGSNAATVCEPEGLMTSNEHSSGSSLTFPDLLSNNQIPRINNSSAIPPATGITLVDHSNGDAYNSNKTPFIANIHHQAHTTPNLAPKTKDHAYIRKQEASIDSTAHGEDGNNLKDLESFEDLMTPEAFEDFMATSISKFRDLQKKRFKEAPFFDEPPPTIPHQNPLNLLYSTLLAKQSLATFLHNRNRPLFSILRAKSDPTIMQSLQTSHFKKLRISGTHIIPENWCAPCQGPDPNDHGLASDSICEDENEFDSPPTPSVASLVPEILSSDQVDEYDDSSDEEIDQPSPRSPSRTHKPSHRTLRPKRSILKLRDKPKQRVPRFVPQSPIRDSDPKLRNVCSPAQPLVVCAHGASATLVRPPALDFNEPGPFPSSDAASIESYRSIKSLQKLQEFI